MNLLKNREIKNIIILAVISFIIFSLISTMFLTNWFNNISSRYGKQNIALVGAILEQNPELEEKIIPIITKGEYSKYYDTGKVVMDKYYYNDNILPYKNAIIKNEYDNFKRIWIGFVAVIWAILLILFIYIIKPIFKNLNTLGQIADNIVEGKFNNKQLSLNEGELSVFYNKFIDMGERLEGALSDLKAEKVNLKNIINDISHQLKTPLSALITYNDILKNHNNMDSETRTKFIDSTSDQLDRMDWLITTLLKYARIESNAINYNKSLHSLKDTINYCMQPLRVKADEMKQNIILDFKGDGLYFHDEKWLGEAFSNIIKNSIEHTALGGNIKVSLEETPLSITVTISDNGEGIEKKDLKNIFKRFYKGKNSLNPKSIGIGLSLSKKIIESHNGSIVAESEVLVGTTFYITFLKVRSDYAKENEI
ncbi:Alkaline phosphatase synthesis sensor protein phoR [uncultured Clostridium sp.]|uniref:sensor histidine kinase n=1 Tax=uncultured Clostridium sp. TaxID=59620 RepID=UPI00082246C0|nr:HAMP domain-containing sensor histidine kinase [uncultured Clostridium sp.]SCI78449.1 Alkaline phosphatase synthesis sensor protein phoR [uncultured Clostridium sp.]